jgi:nucleoside-diphosphate-sugar epimerase
MSKILLTGQTGFIGNYLSKLLIKNNFEVLSLTRSKTQNNFSENQLYKEVFFDINKKNNLDNILNEDIEGIIHLAWGNVKEINSESHLNFSVDVHYDFLLKLIKGGVKNIFVLGTCFEYGKIEGSICESIIPKPVTNYGKAKLQLHNKLIELQSHYNFNLTWGRLFYVYGDGQKSTIYSQLLESIKNFDEKFDMSEGNQKLDYLSIDQVCKIIIKLYLKKSNLGCVNICSGKPIALWKQVENWISENNSKIKLNRGAIPQRSHEPLSFWGNTSYLNKLITSSDYL